MPRRLLRHLFTFCAAASLVMCVAAVVLSFRSAGHRDEAYVSLGHERGAARVLTDTHRIIVIVYKPGPAEDGGGSVRSGPAGGDYGYEGIARRNVIVRGVGFALAQYPGPGYPWERLVVGIPL